MGLNMNLLKGVEEQENAIESSKAYQEEETFLNLMKQGKSRKEAYEAIGREKTWASKIIKKIRETEPERLKGTGEEPQAQDIIKVNVTTAESKNEPTVIEAVVTESPKQPPIEYKLVKTTQEPKIAHETIQAEDNALSEEKTENKANTKPQKQSFSFRADQSKIETWKLYAETIGTKDIGTLWTAAIDEYISNHKLTADQQEIYNLKKKAVEMAKKQV